MDDKKILTEEDLEKVAGGTGENNDIFKEENCGFNPCEMCKRNDVPTKNIVCRGDMNNRHYVCEECAKKYNWEWSTWWMG